jgi:hypothetical protein
LQLGDEKLPSLIMQAEVDDSGSSFTIHNSEFAQSAGREVRRIDRVSQWLTWLKVDRTFNLLRSEPRFIALLKKVGFGSGSKP